MNDVPSGRSGPISRRSLLRAGVVAGAAVVASPILAACGTASPGTAGGATSRSGKGAGSSSLVGSLAESFVQFDPRTNSAIAGICVTDMVFEGVMRTDPRTGHAVNQLASSMPEKVNSTTYRITIRSGATFSDGSPVTPADVVYTLKTMQSPSLGSLYQPYLSIFSEARAIGKNGVEFTLTYPTTLVNDRLAFLKVVPQHVIEAIGNKAFAVHPIGSGPYKFVNAVSNDRVVLSQNTKYNGQLANATKEIVFLQQTDDTARVDALLTGQAAAVDNVPFQDIQTLRGNSTLEVSSIPGNLNALVLFNCGKPPFSDVRVRQAFLYAIDRDAIVKGAYLENARAADNILTPGDPGYAAPTTKYPYDPARAKSLLRAAGYANGFDLELMVANQGIMTVAAPLMQSYLNEAGIKTSIKQGDTEALYSNVTNGKFQAYFTPGDWAVFGRDPDLMLSWLYQGSFAQQYLFWKTPSAAKLSSILDAALRETSVEGAQAKWAAAQAIIEAEVPAFPVFQLNAVTGYSKKIQNFSPSSEAGLYFWNTTAGQWRPS